MILTQHYLACLSQASYLIGDESTARAVVVDPRRDVGVYLQEARERGLHIERVIETHVHADFLSGHLELADQTGAVISYGPAAQVAFPIESLQDGQRLSLGQVTLEILATPGHTPESICVVVWEHPHDRCPYGVLTGDTLFVGDVGRPDLLASASADLSADALARRLYRSLHDKLLVLPDATRVYPAHGAGSACGKALSTETTSTIGEQRRTNYALQDLTEDAFVAAVTEGQPGRPRYFAFDARANQERHALLDERPPELLDLAKVLARRGAGAILLDPREPADFAVAHLAGAVNIGLQGRFAEWAGYVLPPGRDIILAGDPELAAEAKTRLARVGLDRVVGQLTDAASVFASRPELVERGSRLTIGQLTELQGLEPAPQLVDVRAAAETADGTIPGAVEIPLAVLADSLDRLDRDLPVVVYCASGYRSQVAASMLSAAGFRDVSDLLGGYGAWVAAGLPVAHGASSVAGRTRQAVDQEMVVHRADPFNCETSIQALIGGIVTPNARFYVRNHFQAPAIDGSSWRLEVSGLVRHPLALSLRALSRLPSETRIVTLECAGNGRSSLRPPVKGEPWRLGAVSTAEWTGVPLVEVLDRTGILPEAREVIFRGADHGVVDGRLGEVNFERSLPLDAARGCQAILAYAMNGDALPLQHGYPVRLVVPGWYGVASVKWLTAIELASHPFDGYFQADKYWYETDETPREPVTLQQVRALITHPGEGEELHLGEVTVCGFAWSGTAPIARVEVSINHGPWQEARLVGDRRKHSWQWWELRTNLAQPGTNSIRARATDLASRTQPAQPRWNRHGYGNNVIQQVLTQVTL